LILVLYLIYVIPGGNLIEGKSKQGASKTHPLTLLSHSLVLSALVYDDIGMNCVMDGGMDGVIAAAVDDVYVMVMVEEAEANGKVVAATD
jgi:hypothetical protein